MLQSLAETEAQGSVELMGCQLQLCAETELYLS
jgi:hypothetical protein